MTERVLLRDRLLAVLEKAQKQRPQRREADGWIAYERAEMLLAVNRERGSRGMPQLTNSDVETAERGALGHSDYSRKFALYCADLVLKQP